MPLKVDSLIASVVDAQSIKVNGTQVSGSKILNGKINPNPTFISVGSSETLIDSILIPAYTLEGLSFGGGFYQAVLYTDGNQYSDLILKIYVSETQSFQGNTPLKQQTFSSNVEINMDGTLLEAFSDSNFPRSFCELVGDKVYAVSRGEVLTFDNFDVSKDLYLIVTAEKLGAPINLKSIFIYTTPFGR